MFDLINNFFLIYLFLKLFLQVVENKKESDSNNFKNMYLFKTIIMKIVKILLFTNLNKYFVCFVY